MGRISLIVIVLVTGLAGLSIADVRDDLHGIKQEIREKKTELKKNKKLEKQVSGELSKIDQSLKQKEANLKALGNDLVKVERVLGKTGVEIVQATAAADKKRDQIRRRLVSLYKAGELGATRMFFSAESFPQMLENQRYMQAVLHSDQQLFAEYKSKIDQLKGLKNVLERDLAKKENIIASIASKKVEIEEEKAKKAAYLSKVRDKSKSQQASIKELEANARRLQAMMERLEANSRKSYNQKPSKKQALGEREPLPPVADKGFSAQRGRLAIPVKGDILAQFGRHKHPEFNSYTVNNGISIAAAKGTEIRSVFDGQVIFADYFKGYGNMVIIDHGGGYFSLYGHASRLNKKVGAQVARNEAIANVGDVDSSRGTMLYFELRHQGKPIDPAPWFR
ncbi:peptidoglycan DD-metalloendopeptidase family protein [Geobacter pelophilus]|uniref:Peptidoglycan DD-metalloendopeptidase family protein n=1 Tax=Geoanaerobacter pelophilus TaxID=60036 RepID=A0AAW4KW23_9BACT|nr:peptidoglycan DD-metalloendopeptidase family protein [Geoanaerobacter pelophilus]MBT0662778.1 peptidoglycan DD-metalloendopeptidase family protein [Geoanaerobacter pelophilus]